MSDGTWDSMDPDRGVFQRIRATQDNMDYQKHLEICRKSPGGLWQRVKSPGMDYWTIGYIENHSARPFTREDEENAWNLIEIAPNIEQYITHCMELEAENKGLKQRIIEAGEKGILKTDKILRLEAENKRLRDALAKYLHSISEADSCHQYSSSEIRGDGSYCEAHSDYAYEALKALRELVQP